MIKSEATIYTLIERVLKASGSKPMTCVDVFEADTAIRDIVGEGGSNRISDYLGHMWRRGVVQRYYAAQSTARSRYAYTWKEAEEGVVTPRQLAEAKQSYLSAVTKPAKPNVTITESDGRVVLDFDQFTITVQRK